MNVKYQNERNHLLRFLANNVTSFEYQPYKFTSIIKCNDDPPDFILELENKIISFEVSTIHSYHNLEREQHSLNNVLRKLLKKLDSESPNKYYIKFGRGFELIKLKFNEDKLVNQLFDIITNSDKLPEPEEYSTLTVNERGGIYGKHHQVIFQTENGNNFLVIFSKSNETRNMGKIAVSALGIHNPYKEIEDYIEKKEKRLFKYKQNFQENYLLLVTDPKINLGSKYTFDNKFYNHKFKTSFDKIFLMNIDWDNTQEIYELKTC